MGAWPDVNVNGPGGDVLISHWSMQGILPEILGLTGGGAGSDNTETTTCVVCYPVTVDNWTYVQRAAWRNGSVSGGFTNIDVGICDEQGVVRASTGSIAQTVISGAQSTALATPVWIEPGAYYVCIVVAVSPASLSAGSLCGTASSNTAAYKRGLGIRESASNVALAGRTLTFRACTLTWSIMPIAIHGKQVS